jgi:hypothetical protein
MRTFKYLQSVQYTCTSAVQDVNKEMKGFDTVEQDMHEFIKKFEVFDAVCFKHGFKKSGENIELFKVYVITTRADD